MKETWEILVVDDESVMRESLAAWLMEDGYRVDTADSGSKGVELASQTDYAIYFIDLKMPGGMDGIQTMREILKRRPDAATVIITAYATVDTAITAIKEGAYEYVVKPCNPEEISLLVKRIIKLKRLERENLLLKKKLSEQLSFHDIISKNPKMHEIFELIKDVASLKSTVLVTGKSGTGKEMIAKAIHFSGDRASAPFIAVSCGALADSLLESELFGHEKGAFTGAVSPKKGKFEIASGGTIFLDEIGEVSPKLQVELLRVLQERRFFRIGGAQEIEVDVRVIAATNADLQEAVHEGSFREDLFYRLNVIHVYLPSLKDRIEDVPLLANHFLEKICLELGKNNPEISDDALKLMMDYDWPGNIRELQNAMERVIVSCKTSTLTAEDFSFLTRNVERRTGWALPGNLSLEEIEKLAITATLKKADGNVKEAASILGIDRSTLYNKMKKYEIDRD